MHLPAKYLKLIPLLMVLAMIVFLVGDQALFESADHPAHPNPSVPVPEGIGGEPMHDPKKKDMHPHEGDPHKPHEEDLHNPKPGDTPPSDPEAQRRMGIFHYNEGNKFLAQGDRERAVRNYKMALHHNKNFAEALINLSTAYLQGKQFDETRDTLDRLEKINPAHPLLHYNRACYYALTGKIDSGLEALDRAVGSGFRDFTSLQSDPDLETLRRDPRFREWLQTAAKKNHEAGKVSPYPPAGARWHEKPHGGGMGKS